MVDRRTLRVAGWYGAAAVTAIAGALAIRLWAPLGSRVDPVAVAGAYVVLILVTLVLAGQGWRHSDEAAREAHKFATFWGASFGMLAAIMIMAVLAIFGAHATGAGSPAAARAGLGPLFWMMLGSLVTGLGAGLGYALVWAGWWLKRR